MDTFFTEPNLGPTFQWRCSKLNLNASGTISTPAFRLPSWRHLAFLPIEPWNPHLFPNVKVDGKVLNY